ncbi:MAG: ligand-binding protein SH3 [Candidatus Latescibacteria bacterium 4484_7]|nr:MAG: ligand-binding protein SH3 [Candidatus Latescibacteria bacterium 4484_7]
MMIFLFGHLSSLSPRIITLILASLPISELRGAIPYAIAVGHMSWKEAYLLSVIGNFIPVIPILLLLESISNWLRRYPLWNRFFTWLFARTKRKGKLIERFEVFGLILFVAIPLPVTGAWTGCVAAFLFKIRFKIAAPAVLAGIMIAGVIVTLASLGVISFWGIG